MQKSGKDNQHLVYPVEVKLLGMTTIADNDLLLLNTEQDIFDSCAEKLIEYAGRVCWDTQAGIGEKRGRIESWIRVKHHSLLEHSSATFEIECSRVLTHELVRQRLCSFSQRSQRYVKETEPQFVCPPELDGIAKTIFMDAMKKAWDYYGYLLEKGYKPEIARYVLPNACQTQIIMTANVREWLHIVRLRCCRLCQPEMQDVISRVYRILSERMPQVFNPRTCLCYAHDKFCLECVGNG